MADTQTLARNAVVELRDQINSMSSNIRSFSASMKSLYQDDSLVTYTGPGMKLRKVLDDTRDDALVCLEEVLPFSTKFVSAVSKYFDYYEALDYEQWRRCIPQILEETVGYRTFAESLLRRYEDTLIPIKRREQDARLVAAESRELKERFERRKRELEDTASTKRGWAIGLAFVPFVNFIASPALASSAASDFAEAAENGAKAEIQEATALKVSQKLIPALQDLVTGVAKAAGFFSVMEQELRKFEGKAERGQETQKRFYYKTMKHGAKEIKSLCQVFNAALPQLTNDLSVMKRKSNLAIPWLEAFLGVRGAR